MGFFIFTDIRKLQEKAEQIYELLLPMEGALNNIHSFPHFVLTGFNRFFTPLICANRAD